MKYEKISISRELTSKPEQTPGILVVTTESFLEDPFNPVMVYWRAGKVGSRFNKGGTLKSDKPDNSPMVYRTLVKDFTQLEDKERQLTAAELAAAYAYMGGGPKPQITKLLMPYPGKVSRLASGLYTLDCEVARPLKIDKLNGHIVYGEPPTEGNKFKVKVLVSRAKFNAIPNFLEETHPRGVYTSKATMPPERLRACVDEAKQASASDKKKFVILAGDFYFLEEDLGKDSVPLYTQDREEIEDDL